MANEELLLLSDGLLISRGIGGEEERTFRMHKHAEIYRYFNMRPIASIYALYSSKFRPGYR